MSNPIDEGGSRRSVAVVGSGPAGCYLAQFVRKAAPDVEIVVFDRLPVPYGLVRYGVAADHQGTKAVTRQFDRQFEREDVVFAGNIEIGRDLSLEELRSRFDVVVLATGLYEDRPLGFAGDDHPSIYGAGKVTRLLNAHPGEAARSVHLGGSCVIVGNGNVAIDVLRLLVRPESGFVDTDIDDEARAHLVSAPLRHVDIVGRSPAGSARFDTSLIREFQAIEGVRFEVRDLDDADGGSEGANGKLEALRQLSAQSGAQDATVTVTFHFGWAPLGVNLEGDTLRGIRFGGSDGKGGRLELEADSVITAIGFKPRQAVSGDQGFALPDVADPETGRIEAGLYCTGWFRRGPTGTIPENRNDARSVAAAVVAELATSAEAAKGGFARLPDAVIGKAISFEGWQAIDAFEKTAAPPNRRRRKIREHEKLVEIALKQRLDLPEGG
ncbi:pyridine nucleotide-disulfide oxidoreductase [Kaistia sp. 32K]|uniref:FAD-dependent oxidoreductase n=1 Tax=Kaistia sp. 32K TaxID=2795690 RepID=UPI001915EC4C|nr:FAD-dependent oxidoreductase [Kaistia sp. 32K]BCP53985.1 pyridine nucleotide-disulfide oxidoreductase [Kaistia sp. 32K]